MNTWGRMKRRALLYMWVFKVIWRVIGGRWFVLRDAPDFVVRFLCGIPLSNTDDAGITTVVTEARKERAVRRIRKTVVI